ncbi:GMP synthase (glutamine-hydrolyzing), partial [Staphylococcus felis]
MKEEVRALGHELCINEQLSSSQTFPGPDMGSSVLGKITKDKIEIVRESDARLRKVIRVEGVEREFWQY